MSANVEHDRKFLADEGPCITWMYTRGDCECMDIGDLGEPNEGTYDFKNDDEWREFIAWVDSNDAMNGQLWDYLESMLADWRESKSKESKDG